MVKHTNRFFILASILVLAGFVSADSGRNLGTGGNVSKKYRLRYKARKGDILQYTSNQESIRASDRGEEIFETTTKRDFAFRLEADQPGDLLGFVLTIESIKTSMQSPRGNRDTDMSGYNGKRIHVKITSLGEQKEITAIDSLPVPEGRGDRRRGPGPGPGGRRNRAAQFGVELFQLPDREVGIGDSWTETTKDTVRPGVGGGRGFALNQIEERTTKYTVLGMEKKKGMHCLHIKSESTYVREGKGTMGDNEMRSEEEGESTMEAWFAPEEGILVEFINTDFSEGTSAFSGDAAGTMSSTNESKGSLKLVKREKKK
jgi:hypothetical protein